MRREYYSTKTKKETKVIVLALAGERSSLPCSFQSLLLMLWCVFFFVMGSLLCFLFFIVSPVFFFFICIHIYLYYMHIKDYLTHLEEYRLKGILDERPEKTIGDR